MFNRRVVIEFEKLERSSYRLLSVEPQTGVCERCEREVTWITPYQALALTGLTLREIFRRIEADGIHINETPGGLLLICPESLEFKQGDPR